MADIYDAKGLALLREKLVQIDRTSHTSPKFQDDLLTFIANNGVNGASIIEVGCYHGGLTAQLAYVADALDIMLDVIDIDHHYLNVAADTVKAVGLSNRVRFHATDLGAFTANSPSYGKAIMVFIDGDHCYDGVVADIHAIRSLSTQPYATAFHDFSLRYADGPLTIVRVDKAIIDEFGDAVRLQPIGEVAGQGRLRTVPGEDRHFHEAGQPEGVLIVFG